jgi:NADH-quinone oxidoreductase subunit I
MYIYSSLRTLWFTFLHLFHKTETIQYPEQKPYLSPRFRGRIVLTRDPDGEERCVSCYLCAAVCPSDCISLQKSSIEGDWTPEHFRINFSRCIFCGLCEEACPTSAIQLTPDFEMSEYRRSDLVYEKEHLLIAGTGKVPDYNFYRVAGVSVRGKAKGEALNEAPPVDARGLMP